ncbi:UNVERIFIED_CONTAM: hypothetical protein RMT77_018766 [Armadillidium vulgare]
MKLLEYYYVILILTITIVPLVTGGNILFFTPIGSKSHKIFFMGIAEALAKRGHHVTMVSPYESPAKIENIREILIENFSINSFVGNVFSGASAILPLFTETSKLCVEGLGQQNVQDLKKEKFDLIILNAFMDYCYLSFVHHFKIPFLYAHAGALYNPYPGMIGAINFPSISGNIYTEPGFPLSFKQRLESTLINAAFYVMFNLCLEKWMHSECVKSGLCPPDMPSISEMNKNASLMIINSVKTLEWPPRPIMPNVIYAGGAHIKAAKKLPKDLEDWVEGSGEDGFIFFSLGSALNPDFLPEEYREILVKVFSSLKQKVLWKWNKDTMPDLPSNVKLQKWLPQTDLLGHPKIRLFITHGGQLSTLEALFNGVPVMGIPLFSDQHSNMKIVESEGWGRVIDLKKLDEHSFRILIQEMLNNKTITEIAKSKSAIMQDRLIPPDEEAAYWVEYVMRHKGAHHIMSPLHSLSWYEIYNADVWIIIITFMAAALSVSCLIFKFIFKKCFGFGKSIKKKRKMD